MKKNFDGDSIMLIIAEGIKSFCEGAGGALWLIVIVARILGYKANITYTPVGWRRRKELKSK